MVLSFYKKNGEENKYNICKNDMLDNNPDWTETDFMNNFNNKLNADKANQKSSLSRNLTSVRKKLSRFYKIKQIK